MARKLLLSLAAAVILAAGAQPAPKLCDGFLPENDLRISVGSFDDKGMNETEFNAVLDVVQRIYGPEVAARGGVLELNRLWTNDTVNANASRRGNKYIVNMYGGLARHQAVTQDGFALVACHEMAHHLGGAPKSAGWNGWASIEGQADYAANLKCLRRVFSEDGGSAFTRPLGLDPIAVEACGQAFLQPRDAALCVRGTMAGLSVTALFRALRQEETEPRFDTPDPNVVAETDEAHPATQCRLDTYFQGSICAQPVAAGVDDKNPVPGTCTAAGGFAVGLRPLCWYKPPAASVLAGRKEAIEKTLAGLEGAALWQGL
ncbi:MAG: hypothetical protein A2X36_17270 [Elusimicrobia bacterium GWA2_69_24]|nr:MAG: hypothetical protein A2X36_17270 [Elusimicrobia bacterium GWA2_69_24]HBL15307.1 hypothetical protein [Elusimicrobiota bacterium]